MCSIGEDDFGDEGGVHAMAPGTTDQTSVPVDGPCKKCGESGPLYKLSFREAECRNCFLAYARHKFRAALGSSKILPRNAEVLLVFDGSAESLVLLDMLHHAQTQNAFKKLHCNVRILFIDEHEVGPVQSQADRQLLMQNVQDILNPYTLFETFIIELTAGENVASQLRKFQNDGQTFQQFSSAQSLQVQILSSIKSLTARQDYVKQQRNRLIGRVAAHLNCGFVFTPETSTNLATQLLAAITLGRGGSAALDVSLLDDRLSDSIKLVRPLKDLNESEVQLYLYAQQLKPLPLEQCETECGANASLQNLTKSFMTGLQQNFPATVSTVFRTGDKIAPNRKLSRCLDDMSLDENTTFGNCSFCNSSLDYVDSTTLLAVEFSRVVSEAGTTLDKCENLEERALNNLHAKEDKHMRRLCHACRNIQRAITDKNLSL